MPLYQVGNISFLKSLYDIKNTGITFYQGQEIDAEVIKILSDNKAIVKIFGQNVLTEWEKGEITLGLFKFVVKNISSDKVYLEIISPISSPLPAKGDSVISNFLKQLIAYVDKNKFEDILQQLNIKENILKNIHNFQRNLADIQNLINTINFEKEIIANISGERTQKVFDFLWLQNIFNLFSLARGVPIFYLLVPFVINDKFYTSDIKVYTESAKQNKESKNFKISLFFNLDTIGYMLIDAYVSNNKIQGTISIENEKYENFIKLNIQGLVSLLSDIGYVSSINCFVDRKLHKKKKHFIEIGIKRVDIKI